jgi:hypothetical protein
VPVVTAPVAIPSSLPPSGTAGGDLGGTYPDPTVDLVSGGTITGPLNIDVGSGTTIALAVEPNGASTDIAKFDKAGGTVVMKVASAGPAFTAADGTWFVGGDGTIMGTLGATSNGFSIVQGASGNANLTVDYTGRTLIYPPTGSTDNPLDVRTPGGGYAFLVAANGSVNVYGGVLSAHAAGAALNPITDSALPTTSAFASGTAKQIHATRDVFLSVPITTDATANAATCAVALSPDNSTFSTLYTLTSSVAVNTVGAVVLPVSLYVPAAWYVKLTVSHATIGTGTYY